MAKKLQQFYILKFTSDRLKKEKYSIDISLNEAKINGEVITINNSELLRTYFKYKNIEFDQNKVDELLYLRQKIKKQANNEKNIEKIQDITKKIEGILFIEDLVSIEFKNKTHYMDILKRKGFYINGIRFSPFMASAGMIRKNTAMFINNNIKHPIMDILENGRNETVPLVPAKWGAYFSLYSSSTLPVSFPKFAVIADKEIETIRNVDFVEYQGENKDDTVTEKNHKLVLNAFDGQGLISPRLAKKWSDELELGYTFSCAIIRAPFLKGLVVTFDTDLFATQIAKKYNFTDIYGIERDIRDYDLIISESMFKLKDSYDNTEDYIKKCHINNLGFSIAKVNPEKEKSHSRTSYQFLQVLDLNAGDIAIFSKPTIDWFRNISGNDPTSMLLYATGENKLEPKDFDKMDIATKAIAINPLLARDTYIQNKFIKTIYKKKKEAYMGSLLINANYQFMVSDPYYQACHFFGLNIQPLLKEDQYYSEYWLDRNIYKVVAIRSPIVHHSEINVLNFTKDEDVKKWYKHVHSGIIFPANGIGTDCVIHGGADFDGDLICTINNPTIIKGKIPSPPIMYESKNSEKKVVDSRNDLEQVECQLNGYNSKVGYATNISSSLYCLLEEYPEGSIERTKIQNRLKIGRAIQGEIIDSVKGLQVPPFREHWVKYKKITEDMSHEEKKDQEINNAILCKIRPSFFRFLYPHYMTRYNKEIKKYNLYSLLEFGKTFSEIIAKDNKTKEEEELIKKYKFHSFFLDNNSVVNRISRYMRTSLGLIAKYSRKASGEFDYSILQNRNIQLDDKKIKDMKKLLLEYKTFKQDLRNKKEGQYTTLELFTEYLRGKSLLISTNDSELANYAVEITYGDETTMVEFPWKMFPEGILENIIRNSNGKLLFPVEDKDGEINYLWNKYTLKEFSLEDLYGENQYEN